ncbi:MCE family protein [Mycolicibacterium sp. lyk4-40-TYG-92]|uniref:MCE family protein n=1 Tax=Mycolicibacterium sp. lyk4-40-TYG-92 TaxID=3040295 RepID=UPI00254E1B55|nr:MCE family protein [Mycolicibacterium sp. lyk4-40-TYG-92]
MRDNLVGAVWRFSVFAAVCLLATYGLFMVFAQIRYEPQVQYSAEFSNISGLKVGDFVRIAGVEVGKVKHVSIRPDTVVVADFTADKSVALTQGSRAAIRYEDVVGHRYLELLQGTPGLARINPGSTIPIGRTEPALDLDALIGGFRPLFRALDPVQINALSGQLITAFQDQGAAIGGFLEQAAVVTSTLADRDDLIKSVITNLNTVLGSLGDQSRQFDKALTSFSSLMSRFAEHKGDLTDSLAHGNAAALSISSMLAQMRPSFKETVAQSDRANAIVVADHDYFDDFLNTLPDAYQVLARQGMYGDFFTFYLCDALLKVNGKGGQPVYVKLAGQSSGRCTPR